MGGFVLELYDPKPEEMAEWLVAVGDGLEDPITMHDLDKMFEI